MPKTEQMHFKLTPEEKMLLDESAQKLNLTASEYIRTLIIKARQLLTHEERMQNALFENQFINQLLKNPEITNECKQTIGKEIRKYVENKN